MILSWRLSVNELSSPWVMSLFCECTLKRLKIFKRTSAHKVQATCSWVDWNDIISCCGFWLSGILHCAMHMQFIDKFFILSSELVLITSSERRKKYILRAMVRIPSALPFSRWYQTLLRKAYVLLDPAERNFISV